MGAGRCLGRPSALTLHRSELQPRAVRRPGFSLPGSPMRLVFLAALLLTAVPAAAQSARDTTEIRKAAADSGETVARLRLVADTAWADVYNWSEHRDVRDSVKVGNSTVFRLGSAVAVRVVRLERRNGKWATVGAGTLTARDSAAILTAAREWVGKRDSTGARDEIEVRADTASVIVWVRAGRYGREGAKVRVERRADQWVAVRGSTSEIMVIRP